MVAHDWSQGKEHANCLMMSINSQLCGTKVRILWRSGRNQKKTREKHWGGGVAAGQRLEVEHYLGSKVSTKIREREFLKIQCRLWATITSLYNGVLDVHKKFSLILSLHRNFNLSSLEKISTSIMTIELYLYCHWLAWEYYSK